MDRYATKCKFRGWESDWEHYFEIEGRPLSGNTWYVCKKCGLRVFRG